MGYFEDIQNPWSPGGQMSPWMPWAQPGLNYGWGHGNEFFHPKTKEQIQEEALMQLAVLAVVLVAPALVGAGGGAGAGGSLGSGAGTAGGSLGSGGGIGGSVGAGMGTSAEAAGGILTQAEAVSGLVDTTLMAAPMVPAAGAGAGAAAASGGGGALAGVLGALQALQPFLQGDSARVLRSAAQKGPEHLNQELKRRTKDCDCPPKPKFVTEDWLRLHGDCGCDDKQGSGNGGLSSRDGRPHEGMEVLQGVMQLLRKDVGVSQALRQVDHCCSKPLSLDTQQKLRKTIGESLPRMQGVKALEGVMNVYVEKIEDKLEFIPLQQLLDVTPAGSSYLDPDTVTMVIQQQGYVELPPQPERIALATANFDQVWNHFQRIVLYENATNPQIQGSVGTTGSWPFGKYFVAVDNTSYNFSGTTGLGAITINFQNLTQTTNVSSQFAFAGNTIIGVGPGMPVTTASEGVTFGCGRTDVLAGIDIMTVQLPIQMTTDGSRSFEASALKRRITSLLNAGCGIFEKRFAFEMMYFGTGRKKFDSKVQIPLPSRQERFGPRFDYPWRELYNYKGQPIWPPNAR